MNKQLPIFRLLVALVSATSLLVLGVIILSAQRQASADENQRRADANAGPAATELVLIQADAGPGPRDPRWDEVKTIVDYPKYQTSDEWMTLTKALKGEDPEKLKRLGLPVHGHWVKTYVNNRAARYIRALAELHQKKQPLPDPLRFPEGSCIVKENYGPAKGAEFVPNNEPSVLTVMYKFKESYHQTSQSSYNGAKNGRYLGGNWFYGFYFTPDAPFPKKEQPGFERNVESHVTSFCIACHSPAYSTDYVRTLHSFFYPFAEPPTKPYCDQVTQKLPVRPPQPIPPKYKDIGEKLQAYCHPTSFAGMTSPPPDVPLDPTTVFNYYGSKETQRMFSCFAWRTFIALNWPNSGQAADRGMPDTTAPFTGQRSQPTVWETYKPTYEVFQPDNPNWDPGRAPRQRWDQPQPEVICKAGSKTGGLLTLTMTSKIRDVVNETGQAFAGTFGFLVDQNGEKVHYEVLFNQTEFKYLIDNGRAATKNLTPIGPMIDGVMEKITFPDNLNDPRKIGAIEVKSAWKVLKISPQPTKEIPFPDATTPTEAKRKFYVRQLFVYDGETQTCSKKVLGLVGLHIAHKTHFAPQWIWMTFEHKDNVPEYGKKTTASFFDPGVAAYVPPNPVGDCWKYPFLAPNPGVLNCVNVDTNRFKFPDAPNQITRLDPIDTAAQEANETFQKLLGKTIDNPLGDSPFANYVLIGAQWPLHGRKNGEIAKLNCADNGIDKTDRKCFTMVPPHLRNTSMESFMSTYCQIDNGEIQQFSNRSCMGCHGTGGTDFSYVYLDAVTQRVPVRGK